MSDSSSLDLSTSDEEDSVVSGGRDGVTRVPAAGVDRAGAGKLLLCKEAFFGPNVV